MPTFGERFKQLRNEKKLTGEELIDEFNKTFHFSFTKSAISQYENDKRIPEIQALSAFADYFGVSMDYILGKTNERDNKRKADLAEELAIKLIDDLKKDGYTVTEEDIPDLILAAKITLAQKKNRQDG